MLLSRKVSNKDSLKNKIIKNKKIIISDQVFNRKKKQKTLMYFKNKY